jgi:hypothetical protein
MGALTAILGALGGVDKLVGRFFVDKDKAEANVHDEQITLRESVAGEFAKASTTWWDSLVDGLNRLVRPLFTFGTIGLFWWCVVDPVEFSVSMQALALVPDALWMILGTVVAFWFGTRTLEVKAKAKTASEVRAVVDGMKELRAIPDDEAKRDADFQEVMRSTEPLPNDAILEWNRRRQERK